MLRPRIPSSSEGWPVESACDLSQDLQTRNLDVTGRSSTFLGAGIPLARRSVLPTAHLVRRRRRERRGIPWESLDIKRLAFPVGACPAAANRRAIGDCVTFVRAPGPCCPPASFRMTRFAGA